MRNILVLVLKLPEVFPDIEDDDIQEILDSHAVECKTNSVQYTRK